ncbi:Glycosyl hydrolase family 26 [Quadrisphaera granulorum]|uniref:Glycosyl hydrolase family 26 n=1 Tax=Quadrisphaera granulorum TaxID=317664 RepID=A0A316B0X7_9ACTN|nr:glycosyl hydrolase [Quadrisphaera granulorum]PWJ56147.1 glycosyl hydrolase family 26 [Quadrisphaera granulorum]SZE94781.1 Glycosyl hydrolase family 26 [Quadrisphaera granulorum]
MVERSPAPEQAEAPAQQSAQQSAEVPGEHAGEKRPGGAKPSRRAVIGAGVGAVAAAGLATWAAVRFGGGDEDGAAPSPSSSSFVPRSWISGAAGEGVADGAYAAARGSDIAVSATWFDNNEAQLELYTLQPGAEFATWDKPLDISLGAIDMKNHGETWAQAAAGAYEDRWRQSLTLLRDIWGDRQATAYIRFAHEMNGDWYPWKVVSDDVADFKTAWDRYRSIQQAVFSASKLVLCFNRESSKSGYDWRELYPGDGLVDVMGVDYYNQFGAIETAEQWDASMTSKDAFGAPKGLQGHLDFAKQVGLPLAVSEWSGNADEGDYPVFVQKMHEFFSRHGGTGAGELLYEVQFNVDMDGSNRKFLLVTPKTRMPKSAKAYTSLRWGGPSS